MPALIGLGRVPLVSDPAGVENALLCAPKHDQCDAAALNDLRVARDLQAHHVAAEHADCAAVTMGMQGRGGTAVDLPAPLAPAH